MSAHTPGPWYVGELCANRIKVESHQDGYVCEVWRYDADGDANARLVAAAPDLLAALMSAMDILPDCDNMSVDEVMHECRTAIAKAEGRQS